MDGNMIMQALARRAAMAAPGGIPAPMGMPRPIPQAAPPPAAPPIPPEKEEKKENTFDKKEPAKSSASDLDKAISIVASILDKMVDKKSEAATILANAIRSLRDARPMLRDETPPNRAKETQSPMQSFRPLPKSPLDVGPFGKTNADTFKAGMDINAK